MARQILFRRGTTTEHQNFIGAPGEITVDTTLNTLRVHDGETSGGHILAKKENISGMPQTPYVNITVSSHGEIYQAPSDGYFSVYGYAGEGAYVWIHNETTGHGQSAPTGSSSSTVWCTLACRAGDNIRIGYYGGKLNWIRFYPAN